MRDLTSLFVINNGERLLAHLGNRLATLDATTGTVLTVLAARCNAVAYGPPGAGAGDNLLAALDRGILVGNADRPELRSALWEPYVAGALVGQRLVLCHHPLSYNRKTLSVRDRGGRELAVLAEGDAHLPVRGLCALGSTRVAGAADEWVAAWDVAAARQLWQVPLAAGFGSQLATDAAGSCLLVRTHSQQLHCLAAADGATRWQYAPAPAADGAAPDFRTVLVRHDRVLCLFANGEASCLDLTTGRELQHDMLNPAGTDGGALALDNELYVLHADASVVRYDVRDWLGETGLVSSAPATGSFAAPPAGLDAEALLQAVEGANWPAFRWEADAGALLAALHEAEQRLGLTAAHRAATDQLLHLAQASPAPFFKLTHSQGFRSQMESFALSRDGRYLAAGSWLLDGKYDEGGDLQIWDVASGRVVNRLGPVEGGVGWGNDSGMLEWSPDGRLLGLSLNTNGTEAILPFADEYSSQGYYYEPNGKDEPPAWCWHPEGNALFVSCWQPDHDMQGVVVPLRGRDGQLPAKEFGFRHQRDLHELFTPEELGLAGPKPGQQPEAPLRTFRGPQWLTSGQIGGFDGFQAYTLDPQTRTLGALIKNVGPAVIWSPDGQWLLQLDKGELQVFDTAGQRQRTISVGAAIAGFDTGPGSTPPPPALAPPAADQPYWVQPTLSFGGVEVPNRYYYHWHPDPALQLLAVGGVGPQGAVAFYRNLELLGVARGNIGYTLALDPDGQAAATMNSDYLVTVWDLTPGQVRAQVSFPVLDGTKELFYGASQRLIAATQQQLAFYDARTGELVGHYELPDDDSRPELPDNPYLEEAYEDDERHCHFFPLTHDGDTHWVGALPTGEVLADEAVLPALDQELTFTLGNRLPWPYRWGTVRRLEALPEEEH